MGATDPPLAAARASISRRGRGGGSGRGTLPPQLRSSPFRRRATLPAARRRRPFRGRSHPPLPPPSHGHVVSAVFPFPSVPSIGCEIQSDCRTEDVWGRAAIQLACPTAKALRSSCGKTSKAFGEALDSWRQWTGMVLRGEPRCSLGAQLLWKWYGSARLSCVHAPNPSLVTTE